MLEELYLENYVLFTQAALRFGPGLNVISGETGAGKSLLAGALGLALGARATGEAFRQGADETRIRALFRPDRKLGEELGADEDGEVLFERLLQREKPSRLSVQGRPASAAAIKPLSERLVDMAAQNEHTRLVDPTYQRVLLDRYGRLEDEIARFSEAFQSAASLLRRIEAGDVERERVRRQLAEVRHQLAGIEGVSFDPETDPQLEERIRFLSNAETIRQLAAKAVDTLYEGDAPLYDALGGLARETEEVAADSPTLTEALSMVQEAATLVEEAARSYRGVLDEIEAEPGALEATIERAETLKRLARRLGCEVAEIPEREAKLQKEAAELAAWENDTATISGELTTRCSELRETGMALRKNRAQAAKRLAQAVNEELAALEMPAANFTIELAPLWNGDEPPENLLRRAGPGGLETISFRIAPNPGEAASTLAETASGGEASRAMLALKAALSQVHCPPTLFFDEIDAGIGSRLGDVIANKLKSLAATRQVIAITHLPQIAAAATVHLKVEKHIEKKRTVATIANLTGKARIEEIAEMIRGKSATRTTRKQAEELLDNAGS